MKFKQVMWIFLISLLALALTACSGGSGKTSSASVSVKFVEKTAAKTVGAVPANVHRVSISASPSNPANPIPQAIDIFFDLHTPAQSGVFNPLVDGETYIFDVWAYDSNGEKIYFGSATQTMQPGDNIVNITCNPYTPPAPSASAPVWTAKTVMPTARSRAASAMVNGVIYVIGGQDASGNAVSTLEMYNPASNSWTSGSPLPNPRRYAAAVAVMNAIYVIGGENSVGTPVAAVDVLNTQTGTWTTHPSVMMTPRARLACVAHNGLIYAIGGTDAAVTPLSTVEVFNPALPFNNWQSLPSLNTARARFSAVIAKDQSGNAIISVLGGDTPTGPTSSQEIFTLTPTPAASWSNALSLPSARTRQAAVIAGNYGYVVGGEDAAGTLVSDVWNYDFVSAPQSFGTLSLPLPTPRAYPVVQAVDGRVYVIGGEVASGASRIASNAVEELTPAGALPRIGKISSLAGLATVSDASLNGSNLLLVGQQALNGPLFTQLVNVGSATASAPAALNITPIIPSEPDAVMAVGGGKYLVVVSPEASGLYVSTLDAANPMAVLNKVRLDASQAAGTSNNAYVSYNGTTFLVVWNNSGVIYGRFVDINGNPTTAENSYGNGTLQGARFGGTIHLVISGRVQGPNVIIDGTVITPGSTTAAPSVPLFSAPGNDYDGNLGAYNGSQFGVTVAVGDAVNKAVYATAVGFNGVSLVPSPAVMTAPSPGDKVNTSSAWDGFKWGISWFEGDAANRSGFYRFLDTNGTPLGPAVSFAPNLGAGGGGQIWWADSLSSYLLAWGSSSAGYSMAPLQP